MAYAVVHLRLVQFLEELHICVFFNAINRTYGGAVMPYQYGHVYVLVSFMYVLSTLAVVHQFDEPMKTQCVCVWGWSLLSVHVHGYTPTEQ